MTPLFHNELLIASLNAQGLYQAYNQMANLKASLLMASQEQALRSQLFNVMQMRAQLLQAALKPQFTQSLIEAPEDLSSSASNYSESPAKTSPVVETKPIVEKKSTSAKPEAQCKQVTQKEIPNFQFLKAQMEEMIQFLLNNIGKIDQAEIEKMRRRYAHNLYLIPIFDSLVAKYCPVKKHREDIVRYVIRKALKFLKNDTVQKDKVYGKRAYAILCKKYFHFNQEEVEKLGINIEDEKELIEFLLPYRKNSKNRTMNTNFTSEIFSSQEFREDYKKFLDNFDEVLVEDNNRKIQKLMSLAGECLANNCPEKIKKCSRLPWLQSWMDKTREVAFNLLKTDGEDTTEKKVKIDPTCKSTEPQNKPIKLEESN